MTLPELGRRVLFLFRRNSYADDLEAEMRLHRDLRAARLEREGLNHTEALYAAEREFGNTTFLKEESGNMWSWSWLDDLTGDIRHTFRILKSDLLFSTMAILTLALGIGANTAIFSVANAVLLRALPVHNPQQLFYVHVEPGQPDGANNTGNGNSSFSEYVFERLRTQHQALTNLLAYVPAGGNKVAVRTGQIPEEAAVAMVSGDFFAGLGVTTICGRTLAMQDEQEHATVAVLSYSFWSRRYEQNCSALGQTIYVKGVPFSIVGIAAKSFYGIDEHATDIWIPLQKRPELNAWGSQRLNYYADPNWWCLRLIARLPEGVTETRAEALLAPVFQHAAYEHLGGAPRKGDTPRKLVFVRATGIGDAGSDLEQPLYFLLAMVGLVLVIACGNVAMLLAARNASRQREFSLRMAIGGSRVRLFRQLLAESLVLVSSGALLGWLFALAATQALAAWANMEVSLAPDARVLLFTLAIALAAALVFGVAPLRTALRTSLALTLRSSFATAFQEKSKSRAAQGVIALQIALCLVLIVVAGLLVGSLRNLEHENLGMRVQGLLLFGLDPQLKTSSDPQAILFYSGLVDKLRALPGIEAATLMDNRIGSGWSNNTNAIVDGHDPRQSGVESNFMRWNEVGPAYFTTLGVPLRLGRDFTLADSAAAPKVAIVNETFVQRFLKGREPLGHQVSYAADRAFTIVGVAGNSKYTGVRESEIPMAYFPYPQVGHVGSMNIALRTAGSAAAFWPIVRKAVTAYAPELPLLKPATVQTQFDDSISQERLIARLALCFGGLAILLVATGLYGTLAYSTKRRTSELGLRMAVGAQAGELLWMILRESLLISAAGIIIGLPLTFGAARFLASLLFGLAPYDPLNIGLGVLGIVMLSLVASLVPALRAASIDPVVALRHE